MTIHVPFQNPDGKERGHIDIDCIDSTAGREPDAVHTYQASIVDHPGDIPRRVTVQHRYGDHWTVLLAKVLQAYEMQ